MADNVTDTTGSPADINERLEEFYLMIGSGGGSVETPEGVRQWRRIFAERGRRSVRVLSLGDSWAAPYGASRPDRGWTARLSYALGDEGSAHTISPTGPHSVNISGAHQIDDNANPHRVAITGDGVITFNDLGPYDTIDVNYLRVNKDGGGFDANRPQFSIDGGAYSDAYDADIELLTPGTSYRLARLANFTGNTLRLKPADNAVAGSYVFPIIARRGALDRGVEWLNYAQPGWTTAQWMGILTGWSIAEPLMSMKADLFHVNTGANDALAGQSTAFTINELRNMLSLYRGQVNPGCAILATLMPYPNAISDAAWDERMDAIATLVTEEFGGMVVDWRKSMGRQSEMESLITSPSDFHLDDDGHLYASDDVFRTLG